METILEVAGWIAWAITGYFALTFAYGVRNSESLMPATVLSAMLLVALAVSPFFGLFDPIHLVWLTPVTILFGTVFLAIPLVGLLLSGCSRAFYALMRIGKK